MNDLLRGLNLLVRSLFARSRERRYGARFHLLAGIAHRAGFRLYNRNLHWLEDPEYLDAWAYPVGTIAEP